MLLTVLILTTVFAALALSLLAMSESSIRAQSNGFLLRRAERAAQSGIEWAAAGIAASGESAGTTVVPIGESLEARVQVIPGASPNVVAEGRCGGVAVTVQANVKGTPVPLPYNLVSFGGTSQLAKNFASEGPAFFGDATTPIDFTAGSASPALTISGDLNFVASPTIPAGYVNFQGGGGANMGLAAIPAPVWDTSAFLGMSSGAVTVYQYSGSVYESGQTFDGIVVINVAPGDTMEFEDCTINGTLVVHANYDPNPFPGAAPNTLSFKKTVTINGGTALTGNLAVLAPSCDITFRQPQGTQLNGVVLVGRLSAAKNLNVDGQLLVRGSIHNAHPCQVTVPNGFAPDVPIGLQWPPSNTSPQIEWLGRL